MPLKFPTDEDKTPKTDKKDNTKPTDEPIPWYYYLFIAIGVILILIGIGVLSWFYFFVSPSSEAHNISQNPKSFANNVISDIANPVYNVSAAK